MGTTRREMLRLGGLFAAYALLPGCAARAGAAPGVGANGAVGEAALGALGPLRPDPAGILDLPEGFRYVVLQRAGEPMADGHRVPAQPDGMACHALGDGRLVLLRNHELGDPDWGVKEGIALDHLHAPLDDRAYAPGRRGGVARVLLDEAALRAALTEGGTDADGRAFRSPVLDTRLVLAGTDVNCAGGRVAEGWVSCEESDAPGHGYAFLTRADDTDLVRATERRLTRWGRFRREGITLGADGAVYMTEDHKQASFYRFVPTDPTRRYDTEGTVEALVIEGLTNTDPDEPLVEGTRWKVRWIPVPDPQAATEPCRAQAQARGAARFTRCEGIHADGDAVWFVASTAGPAGAGQVWRLDPGAGTITLVVQVTDRKVLSMPDNLVLAPWGHLVLAEDNYDGAGITHQHLRALTATGRIYALARNARNAPAWDAPGAEFAGPCFSPDGTLLFVNMQSPENVTIAITGPWERAAAIG